MRRLPAWRGTEPYSPGNGDGQRPNVGQIWLLQGIEPDYHRSEGYGHPGTSRYSNCQLEPRRLVSHLIVKSVVKAQFELFL